MFVDATFRIVPHPFYQCLIVMVFDASLKIYIPVAWILMTGKTEECYWQAFNWLSSTAESIDPSYIGVDFERAFFSQAQLHFQNARPVGCLFHFKQAARKKMIHIGILKEEVSFAMRSGVFDLITVIPLELMGKGIAFIHVMIIDHVWLLYQDKDGLPDSQTINASREKWDSFWDGYFKK